jgi:hypothetical protein
MRPRRRVRERDEMLDRRDGSVREPARDECVRERPEKPLGDPFDDAVQRRKFDPQKGQRHDRAAARG